MGQPAAPRLCTTRVSRCVTFSATPPAPTAAPWTGMGGGAAPECADLAAAYVCLRTAILASAARGDVAEENRQRNLARIVLGLMHRLRCPKPDAAELRPRQSV